MTKTGTITVALTSDYIGLGFTEELTGLHFSAANKFYPIEVSLKHDLTNIKRLIHEKTLRLVEAPEGFELGEAPLSAEEIEREELKVRIAELEKELADVLAELEEAKKAPKATTKAKTKAAPKTVKEDVKEDEEAK